MRGGVWGQAARGLDDVEISAGLCQSTIAIRRTGGAQPATGLQREAVRVATHIQQDL